MKKIYAIYGIAYTKSGRTAMSFSIIESPDFHTEKEAEEYLLKNIKPQGDITKCYFILPTYQFLPLDSE